MSRRSDPALQGPPSDPATLAAVPAAVDLGRTWFREHEERDAPDRGCWWFSSHAPGDEPLGRFDLTEPHGTCYLGETVGVAVRERCGRLLAARLPIPESHLHRRVVTAVVLMPLPGPIADTTHPDAATVGINGELAAGNDYEVTASWADAFHSAGFQAILYQPRFTPGHDRALALFGDGGSDPDAWPTRGHQSLAEAVAELGYAVSSVPSSQGLADDEASPDDATVGDEQAAGR